MACKKCGGEIKHIDSEKNYLKKCSSCHGLLILENNLLNIIKQTEEIEVTAEEHNEDTSSEKPVVKKMEYADEFISELNCHECNTPMEKYEYTYSSGIYINRCPNCAAVWLDKGELSRIAKYLNDIQEYDGKINQLLPKIIEIKRQVNSTFQKIKEDSNPWFKSNKE